MNLTCVQGVASTARAAEQTAGASAAAAPHLLGTLLRGRGRAQPAASSSSRHLSELAPTGEGARAELGGLGLSEAAPSDSEKGLD